MKLEDTLPIYVEILETEIVSNPLILDEKTSILLDGYETYQALDLLSVEKAPVFKIDLKEVKVKTLNPETGTVSREAILEAGLKGLKLPPKSFSILTEPVKISVPLKELFPRKNWTEGRLKFTTAL